MRERDLDYDEVLARLGSDELEPDYRDLDDELDQIDIGDLAEEMERDDV